MSAVLKAQEPGARYLANVAPPLVRQFDLLATAPGGVAGLRQLILTLAVQGKLLPQNRSDEPVARQLLEIAAAKSSATALTKRGKSTDATEDVVGPFELPSAWSWVWLGDVTQITGGVTLGRKGSIAQPVTLPYLRVANVQRWRVLHDDLKTVTIGAAELPRFQVQQGDLLITEGGDWDKVGRTAIWRGTVPCCLHQNHVFKARGVSPSWNPAWAELYLNSPVARAYFAASAKQTTNLASINMTQLKACPFPLPPLAEQARIVARVDELMRLCDALEAKGRLEAEHHQQLLTTLLGTLTDSRTHEELADNWQRVADHFDLLLDRPAAIDAVETLAVRLALRGLLTAQDADDEPATRFIARINANRVHRRASAATPVLASVDAEGLPAGWAMTSVGSVAECLDYIRRPVKKADRETGGGTVPYYGANGQVGWIDEHLFDEDLVLVVEDETFIGRTKPFSYVIRGKSWVNNHAHVLRPLGGMSVDYLDLCLQRYDFIPLTSGTTNRRKLTQPGLLNATFMVAPLEEQARIVSRVDQLRRLCSDLRQRLAAGQAVQAQLADALMENGATA